MDYIRSAARQRMPARPNRDYSSVLPAASFGALLRRHRSAAGLTQEQLAERAGLSRRGIADLERGARLAPYVSTVERLAAALDLSEGEGAALMAVGRHQRKTGDIDREPSKADVTESEEGGLRAQMSASHDAELRDIHAACERALSGTGDLVLVVRSQDGVFLRHARNLVAGALAVLVGHMDDQGFASLWCRYAST